MLIIAVNLLLRPLIIIFNIIWLNKVVMVIWIVLVIYVLIREKIRL